MLSLIYKMMLRIIFAVSLVVVAVSLRSQHLGSCTLDEITHNQFALTWLPEYCSETSCSPTWMKSWDKKSFTIHGLWPSRNYYDPSCDDETICHTDFIFSKSYFSDTLIAELNKYWPAVGAVKDFWKYQWNKHGICYLTIQKQRYGSKLSDKQLFVEYFSGAVGLVKKLDIKLIQDSFRTKAELATAVGLSSDSFGTFCMGDDELDEIRVCTSLDKPLRVIKCPVKPKDCRFPIYMQRV